MFCLAPAELVHESSCLNSAIPRSVSHSVLPGFSFYMPPSPGLLADGVVILLGTGTGSSHGVSLLQVSFSLLLSSLFHHLNSNFTLIFSTLFSFSTFLQRAFPLMYFGYCASISVATTGFGVNQSKNIDQSRTRKESFSRLLARSCYKGGYITVKFHHSLDSGESNAVERVYNTTTQCP